MRNGLADAEAVDHPVRRQPEDQSNRTDCTAFLQWALPQLGMRWAGFRRVRGQVCKRLGRRMAELGLRDLADYRALLDTHPQEWTRLEGLCRISISRFYRDQGVWRTLEQDIRQAFPQGRFDLILCRNLVFTYFETTIQAAIARRLIKRLAPEGVLVLGIHESLHEPVPMQKDTRVRRAIQPRLI